MSIAMPRSAFLGFIFTLLLVSQMARAQTSAFTYQGKLSDSGNPANGQPHKR